MKEGETVAGRTLIEWREFARRDDCLDRMVPSDLRQLIGVIDGQSRDLATFGKDTVDTENRIINAEFAAQSLRVTGEAFRLAMVQSGALNSVPQDDYFTQLRAFETALAAR